MAYSDRELLARLIQCEAGGEGPEGMMAVAGVVMNRVHARGGEYARVGQGSIRNIIFQPYQFVCASETEGGAYNPQNIYNMRPEAIHCGQPPPRRGGIPLVLQPLQSQMPQQFPLGCGLLADPHRGSLFL